MTSGTGAHSSADTPVASRRRTPRNAFGISAVWVMAASLTLCVAMIVSLFGVILAGGAAAFWRWRRLAARGAHVRARGGAAGHLSCPLLVRCGGTGLRCDIYTTCVRA